MSHVKDDTKMNALLSVLNEISFIEIEKEKEKKLGRSRQADLRKLFGLWKGRNISLSDIRKKAWR